MGVDALPCVLTGVGSCKTQEQLSGLAPGCARAFPSRAAVTLCELTQRALVHVLVAGWPHVPRRTRADGFAVDGVGVAVGAFVAGVADAGIIQVAQQTWAARGACQG